MLEQITKSEPGNWNPAAAPHSGLRFEAAGPSAVATDKPTDLCALVSHRFSLTADTPLEVAPQNMVASI